MKRSFTLIELLISFTILAVISGGALIYLNNFNAQQNLDKMSNEVVSSLKLSQSYAKTRQVPIGSAETELRYVQVQMVGSNIVARANGVGETFFNINVNNNGIEVRIFPESIYFRAGNGFLSHDGDGTVFGVGETVTVTVQSQNNFVGYNLVIVNALGQARLISYNEGVIPSQIPMTPTSTSCYGLDRPILRGGTNVCCSPLIMTDCYIASMDPFYMMCYCRSIGTIATPTPTLVPAGCLAVNTLCTSNSQCCSGFCSYRCMPCLPFSYPCTAGGTPCCVGTCTNGFCPALFSPTPACKLGGVGCSVHGDCCSSYCSTLHFCN